MESARALVESQQRLRMLDRRIRDEREEERCILSREIHDNLGQMLTVLKMGRTTASAWTKARFPIPISSG